MKIQSQRFDSEKAFAGPPWWRRPEVQIGLVAFVWLGSALVAVAMKAWPMLVLLIVLGVVMVRVLQVLAYRD